MKNSKVLKEKVEYILSNPLEQVWEIQGFGMMRTYIDTDTRVQIWLKDFIVPDVTDIHTHPWNFISYIYQGEITNYRFVEFAPSPFKKEKTHKKCLIKTGANAYVKHSVDAFLCEIKPNVYSEGETYYHPHNVPHRIDFIDGTITILAKNVVNKWSEAFSYVVDGKEWVSAAPRLATKEEIEKFINAALRLKKKEENEQKYN